MSKFAPALLSAGAKNIFNPKSIIQPLRPLPLFCLLRAVFVHLPMELLPLVELPPVFHQRPELVQLS